MENRKELMTALQKFQDEAVFVKAATEGHHGKYANFSDVVSNTRKPLKDNGLMVQQSLAVIEGKVAIETIVVHVETGQVLGSTHILSYQGEDAQKQGSAITYAKRYSYVTILGLLVDADDDGQLASTLKDEKVQDAKDKLAVAKNLADLKKTFLGLGRYKANKEVIAFKNELKELLEESEEEPKAAKPKATKEAKDA